MQLVKAEAVGICEHIGIGTDVMHYAKWWWEVLHSCHSCVQFGQSIFN